MRTETSMMDRYSFRLDESSGSYSDSSNTDQSSVYKKRIDSLFKHGRTVYQIEPTESNSDYETVERIGQERCNRFLNARSAVKAQMERNIALSQNTKQASRPLPLLPDQAHKYYLNKKNEKYSASAESNGKILQTFENTHVYTKKGSPSEHKNYESSPKINSAKFKVDYLGALPIEEKSTQLEDLQLPLMKLYTEYRRQRKTSKSSILGSLAITETGVKVTYVREQQREIQELFNPFATIAVWAAVKLVLKKTTEEKYNTESKFAFLPLICDPEGQEKLALFKNLEQNVFNLIVSENHPPIFACVMRKTGSVKPLECHGFACSTPEDAIVIAANLYQALLSSIQSDTGSNSSTNQDSSESPFTNNHIGPVVPTEPSRPPRGKKAHQTTNQRNSRNVRRRPSSAKLPNIRGSDSSTNNQDQRRYRSISRTNSNARNRRLTRSTSNRRRSMIVDDSSSKTLRKTSLPRSTSLFEIDQKLNMRDFLVQIQKRDGIRTVNDVLRQVVNPEGMSFSELKPEHRELLLRLALTLSQDEMYQRSKHLMKKLTKKLSTNLDNSNDLGTISNMLKATKKSFFRFGNRSRNSLDSNTSSNREGSTKTKDKKEIMVARKSPPINTKVATTEHKLNRRYSSFAKNPYQLKAADLRMPRHVSSEQLTSAGETCDCSCDSESIYSVKCYCTLDRAANNKVARSKSTYDLPCECDTESCAESEKCYCSLKKITKNGMKMYEIKLDTGSDWTDSTIGTRHTIRSTRTHNQCVSMSNLSCVEAPTTGWRKIASAARSDTAERNSRSSLLSSSSETAKNKPSSVGYTHKHEKNRRRTRSSNFAMDNKKAGIHSQISRASKSYSIDNLHHSANGFIFDRLNSDSSLSMKSNQNSKSASKFMLVSAADPNGKIIYRSGSQKRRMLLNQVDPMSLKKTTEIAATFSGLKLNQTTDLLNESEDDAYGSMQTANQHATSSRVYSDQNIENSLGYLP